MFGIAVVPSILLALGMTICPESPRWLYQVVLQHYDVICYGYNTFTYHLSSKPTVLLCLQSSAKLTNSSLLFLYKIVLLEYSYDKPMVTIFHINY